MWLIKVRSSSNAKHNEQCTQYNNAFNIMMEEYKFMAEPNVPNIYVPNIYKSIKKE